ncbi:MAG: MarC family protein [Candidatus Freyarchaeota archaeon]|nr:MarC family protein [Candidatus Jordarchaeia archaeon]
MDPVGNIPIFLSLTEHMSVKERKRAFHLALVTGFTLLMCFAAVGNYILFLFGITIESFMIAGGILLMVIALRILILGWKREETVPSESIGVVPIACPLLVGPGAITTAIMYLQSSGVIVTVTAVILSFIVTWLVLKFIDPFSRFLGRTGSLVIARVMALIIAAIAVELIIKGIAGIFK